MLFDKQLIVISFR